MVDIDLGDDLPSLGIRDLLKGDHPSILVRSNDDAAFPIRQYLFRLGSQLGINVLGGPGNILIHNEGNIGMGDDGSRSTNYIGIIDLFPMDKSFYES